MGHSVKDFIGRSRFVDCPRCGVQMVSDVVDHISDADFLAAGGKISRSGIRFGYVFRCPKCRQLSRGRIIERYSNPKKLGGVTACGGACLNAKGGDCDCVCGGACHGAGSCSCGFTKAVLSKSVKSPQASTNKLASTLSWTKDGGNQRAQGQAGVYSIRPGAGGGVTLYLYPRGGGERVLLAPAAAGGVRDHKALAERRELSQYTRILPGYAPAPENLSRRALERATDPRYNSMCPLTPGCLFAINHNGPCSPDHPSAPKKRG